MIFSLPLSNKTRQQSTHQIGDLVFSSIPIGATSPIPSTHIFEDKYTHTMEEKMRKVISNPSSDVCVDMPGRTWEHQTTVERQKEKKKKLGHFWHSKKETWLGKHWNIRSFWCRNVHYTRLPSHPQANQLFHVHSQLAGVDWKQKSDDDVDLLPEHSSVLLSSVFFRRWKEKVLLSHRSTFRLDSSSCSVPVLLSWQFMFYDFSSYESTRAMRMSEWVRQTCAHCAMKNFPNFPLSFRISLFTKRWNKKKRKSFFFFRGKNEKRILWKKIENFCLLFMSRNIDVSLPIWWGTKEEENILN